MHHLKPRAPLVRFAPRPVALVAWALLHGSALCAQGIEAGTASPSPAAPTQDEAPVQLQSSPLLQ
ncbi:MAG: hypothetical protein ABI606_17390, partial [Rhodoferax sp.]